MRTLRFFTLRSLLWGFCLITPTELWALEKYGRPLPEMGEAHEQSEEQWLRGYLLTGAFVHNPSFAARPDNSGLVGLRHMIHLETDIYKEYLQFYTDQNVFSDRKNGWISLSEWDSVYAFTGTIQNWGWRLQYERDAPMDRSGIIQAYADTLVTYRPANARSLSWWRSAFPEQNLTVYAGAGWLFHNQTYFARPDNTGRALFRYVAHADLDLYRNRVVLFVDGNFFTDRSATNALQPSEFDAVMGLALRYQGMEIALIHERDMPLDQVGLVQRYTTLQLRYEFEWTKSSSPVNIAKGGHHAIK
ncbi:MAG: hypothetical protein JW388_0172 [Nitrospira sp.]|nr:hypothetical protein [Nitrospira sp.]